jgi:hypothetical protein
MEERMSIKKTDGKKIVEKVKIIRLKNSHMFSIRDVFVILHEDGFRLIALDDNSVYQDQIYNTLRGAKIAFSRIFKHKKIDSGEIFKTDWTDPYPVECSWLLPRIEQVEQHKHEELKSKESENINNTMIV